MLLSLHLKNLAIVDSADLELNPGMTAITGETGVGKSILIDGLSLVLGGRADSGIVGASSNRAEIIAEFNLANADEAHAWLQERSLES
ncbi:MAG: DNA repair protein RecN, partial [Gammaproteobacteria bacterium]|nr:DNA repair protein RecN [Gammaproteobacteria bacterium]